MDSAVRYREIAAIVVSVAVVGLTTGMTLPLVALRLESAGVTSWVQGLAAALPAIGMLLIAPYVNHLTQWVSTRQLLMIAALGSLLTTVLLGIYDSVFMWFILRLLSGMATAVLVILGETSISQVSSRSNRGRMLAIYTTTFTVFQVAGPSILALTGSAGWAPLAITALAQMLGLMLLAQADFQIDLSSSVKPMKLTHFFIRAPVVAIAVIVFAFFDAAVLSVMPLYGLQHQLAESAAVMMVSIVFIGDAAFQMAIGWAADTFDRKSVHILCGLGLAATSLFMPIAVNSPTLRPIVLLAMGATAGGIYTIGLVKLGDYFTGRDLLTANAGVGMLWAVGSFLGPMSGNIAIALVGTDGLMIVLTALALLFVGTAALKESGRRTAVMPDLRNNPSLRQSNLSDHSGDRDP